MLKQLEKLIQLPDVFAASKTNFWNDPHISKELLKAHLDHDFEGASRKKAFIKKSVSWILQICQLYSCEDLLDLGCGPGLYTLPLAEKGFSVTGIDFSRRSISYAQSAAENKALKLSYYCEDYLSINYASKFDIAVMIYCDYGALSDQNRKTLLEKVYQSLRPGGLFLLDVFSISRFAAFEESTTWSYYPNGGFWHPENHIAIQQNKKFPSEISLENTVIINNSATSTYHIWNKYFTVGSLNAEIENAGFRVVSMFSDVSGAPFSSESSTIAVLLQK